MDTNADLTESPRSELTGQRPTRDNFDESFRWIHPEDLNREALMAGRRGRGMDSVVASAMISGVAREAREDRLRETYGRGEPSEPTTEGFASALRENLHDDMADSRSFNRETLRPGQIAISFPVESYHVATSIPRVEMIRASRRDAILARVSMDIAGKLNNAMVQHLVKDCKTEELLRYKRSIIEEIKKRNQGERHE